MRLATRRKTGDASPLLRIDDLVLNQTTHDVLRGGKRVHLSQREFEVLCLLMQHPGRPLTRTEICERVWKSALDNETNAVDVYIQRIRSKVDGDSSLRLIHTVRGIGYMLGTAGQ